MAIGTQNISPQFKNFTNLGWDRQLVASLEEMSKIVTTIWTYHDEWKALSEKGLGEYLVGKLVSLLLGGLYSGVSSVLAELGIDQQIIKNILNPSGELKQLLIEELAELSVAEFNASEIRNRVRYLYEREEAKAIASSLNTGNPIAFFIQFEKDLSNSINNNLQRLIKGNSILNSPDPSSVNIAMRSLDPILLQRGEFERQVIDLVVNGAGIDFSLIRTYRSSVSNLGRLGANWDFNYDVRLFEENENVLTFKNGQLVQRSYFRHPRYNDQDEFAYFTPPNGFHDIFVRKGNSFNLIKPKGNIYSFEPTTKLGKHRLKRIEDRFGNYLEFKYSVNNEDLLTKVYVNNPNRLVFFNYDSVNRLQNIEDHTGRRVTYTYDDYGQLDCVAGPFDPDGKPCKIESYEYDQVGGAGFKLGKVYDWKGRILVENEYDSDPLSDYFGYIIRQRENRGEAHLVYESISENFDPSLPQYEMPDLRVWEYKKNGHQIERWLNKLGHELMRKEYLIENGSTKQIASLNKYNADGQVIAQIDPNGVLSQKLFGREEVVSRFEVIKGIKHPDIEFFLDDITISERQSFGNLLSQVIRGREISLGFGDYSPELWNQIPSTKSFISEDDIITKYTYLDNQLVKSKSDPRYTKSADPLHVESAHPGTPNYDNTHSEYIRHQKHLVKYEYSAIPRLELKKTIFPNRTRPFNIDGESEITGIKEEIISYDAKGRPLVLKDLRGYIHYSEYYDSSTGSKEGFLKRTLTPHIDWKLNNSSPNILEIEYDRDNWNSLPSFLQSKGNQGDKLMLLISGVKIELYQDIDLSNIVDPNDGNRELRITVDGNERSLRWNQIQDTSYVIPGLSRGRHEIEVQDINGASFYIGRVRTWAAKDFELNELGQIIKETDRNGNDTFYTLDELGRPLKIVRGAGMAKSVILNKYDQSGYLVEEKMEWRDENGKLYEEKYVIEKSNYDKKGFLLSQSFGAQIGEDHRETIHKYDSEDNLCHTINSRGISTLFQHDVLNRQKRIIRASCSPDQIIDRFVYDLGGRPLATYNPRNALMLNGYQKGNSWISGYDTLGRLRYQSDAKGNLTVKDFDKLGNILVNRFFWKKDTSDFVLLSRIENQFDEHGSQTVSIEFLFKDGIITTDPFDLKEVDKKFEIERNTPGTIREAITKFCLDAEGNVTATENAENAISSQVLDGQGRVYDSIDSEENRSFQIFDENSNLLKHYQIDFIKDGGGNFDHNEYFISNNKFDALNRKTKTIDSHGNVWEQLYDSLGNIVKTIDPLKNIIKFSFNAFGEEIRRNEYLTDNGLGNGKVTKKLVTHRVYDENGNLITIIDPARRKTEFRYDALDRQVETWFAVIPNAPKEIKKYDPNSNLIELQDRNRLIKKFQYDELDRQVTMHIDETSVLPQNQISDLSSKYALYTYDGLGRLIKHKNEYAVVETLFDSRGSEVEQISRYRDIPNVPETTFLVQLELDIMGRLKKIIYPSRREVSYSYDSIGRIKEIKNERVPSNYVGIPTHTSGFKITEYRYSGTRLSEVIYGNGLKLRIQYDGRGIVTDRIVLDGSSKIWRDQKVKGPAGSTRLHNYSVRNHSLGKSRKYFFDNINQLVHYEETSVSNWIDTASFKPDIDPFDPIDSEKQTRLNNYIGDLGVPVNSTSNYDYDEMGNRITSNELGPPPISYQTNDLNQYYQTNRRSLNYDFNGNLKSDSFYSYEYDINNNLQIIKEHGASQNVVNYIRNAVGQVIAEQITNKSFLLCRHQNNILSELVFDESKTQILSENVEYCLDANNSIIHFANNNEEYWVTKDGIGSLRLMTDSNKNLISIPIYLPFGKEQGTELSRSNFRFSFGGMWRTRHTEFLHSQSRSYLPTIGRFMQRDPGGIIDNINPYLYVSNNPIDLKDPSGYSGEGTDDFNLNLKLTLGSHNKNAYDGIFLDEMGPLLKPPSNFDIALDYAGRVWDFFNYGIAENNPHFDTARYYNSLNNQYEWDNPGKYLTYAYLGLFTGIGYLNTASDLFLGSLGWLNEKIDPTGELSFALLMASYEFPGMYDNIAAAGVRGIQMGVMGSFQRTARVFGKFSRSTSISSLQGPNSLWISRVPGVQLRRIGNHWVKRVNPKSSQLMQFWGRNSIEAQQRGLTLLGDMATPFKYSNGILITRDVGSTGQGFRFLDSTARRAYLEGSRRMGTFFNDIQPRNMGLNGLIFDPAIDPVSKSLFFGGAGLSILGGSTLGVYLTSD